MFRALLCPSSGARQTAAAASGFRMNVEVEVFSAVVGLLANLPRLGTLLQAAGRSPAEIVGPNPTGGMDICLL